MGHGGRNGGLREGLGARKGNHLLLLLWPPDVTLSPWSSDSKCHQRRVLTYTIPISNPLGPKSASVVETQVGWAGWPGGAAGLAVWGSPDSPAPSAPSPPARPCFGEAHRRAGAWWTLRCSRRGSPTKTTSIPRTATASWAWPGTRPGFGEPRRAPHPHPRWRSEGGPGDQLRQSSRGTKEHT